MKDIVTEKNKNRVMGLVSIFLSTLLCLIILDYLIGWYQGSINNSMKSDPGLLRYHSELGWTLTPNWSGAHKHHDFDVSYQINSYGFRGEFPTVIQQKKKQRIGIVGDSFSFGLGVNDDETYSAMLNETERYDEKKEYLNFSTPGSSTDQHYLLIKQYSQKFQIDHYILAVYLGNDILDNILPFPLQVEFGKPYFTLDEQQELQLQNTPVPKKQKPASLRSNTLSSVIFGEELAAIESGFDKWRRFSHILQRLIPQSSSASPSELDTIFKRRLHEQTMMMSALLAAIKEAVDKQGAELTVALLPGRSYVLAPSSHSANFQEYVRRFLIDELQKLSVAVIDVASVMRKEPSSGRKAQWFFPNEGHYTKKGHAEVAEIILDTGVVVSD